LAPKLSRGQLATALLCAILGFGTVIQVRQTAQADFSGLREVELVQLLDQLTQRSEELAANNADLSTQRDQLASSQDQAAAALQAAQARADTQGLLAGTLQAQGPGLILTIIDTKGALTAAEMYHVIEELRNAGAEAIALGPVRVNASTWVGQGPDGLIADGVALTSPYVWRAIGDPRTLEVALNIPGGVTASVRNAGGTTTIERQASLVIDVVKELAPTTLASHIPEE
jgi:uncharacterized protein YlxW (UPF0749 family)